jgi:hypothetical protein
MGTITTGAEDHINCTQEMHCRQDRLPLISQAGLVVIH